MVVSFESRETLLDRLTASRREVVFLVGAPLTAPGDGAPLGVPGVAAMITRIRARVEQAVPRALGRFDVVTTGSQNPYQAAFGFLAATLGQDDANAVIRGAVLEALRPEVRPSDLPDGNACARLEKQLDEWHYRPGVAALGQLAARFPDKFGGTILTTNFDPLLELSIRRAGGRAHSSFFPGDGSIEQARGEGCHVVHLHGSWYGADTLHVPAQLGNDRPRLRASLSRLLQNRTVVVMAYGGWDDIFVRTLSEVGADPGASPDVLWCFYDKDHERLRGANQMLFDQLRPMIGGRAILYAGIDCHAFLPDLVTEHGGATMATVPGTSMEMAPVMDDAEFTARKAVQEALLTAFTRRQAVQLIGPRRMGKSSLLRWLERKAQEIGRPAAFVNARGLGGRSPADLVLAAADAIGKREAVCDVLFAERAVPDAADAARALSVLAPVCLLVDEAGALAEKDHGFDRGFFDAVRALGQEGRLQWVSSSERDLFDLFLGTGLTSAFLNDAQKIHVGAMSRAEAETLLREVVKDGFRMSFAWELAGGFPVALKWLGPKLSAAGADPGQVERDLARWIKPLLQQWWERLSEEERGLLKRALVEALLVAPLAERERRMAQELAENGFLVEADAGRLTLGGKVWREFVKSVC